ncbi:MAG: phage major capsid protein [Clostridia bacterium]|nr:phage major capsid protein [Clostridia bacterium]
MVTLTNAENALKTVYLGAVTDLLNTKTNPLLAKIEHTATDVWGKEVRTAARVGLNGGIGAGDETGSLPGAFGSNYIQFVTTLKNLYGKIEISDKAIRASADGRGAFTDLLNSELESLLSSSKFNLGRMLYGDGSGKLCTVITTGSMGSYEVDDTRNLIEGMVVDVYSSSGTLTEEKLRISYVNRDESLVFFTNPSVNVPENSTLYMQGSKDREITGIGALFDTEKPLYGLTRSAYPYLAPYSKAVNDKIDEVMIQKAIDRLEHNANSTVDFIAVSADVKYAYQNYMKEFKRNIDMLELDGGYKTLSYNGIPLVYDRFIEDGTMYLLDTSAFKMHQLCDWRYLENENGKILRQTPDKPTYTATLVKYCDLVCSRPNGQAKLTGITG